MSRNSHTARHRATPVRGNASASISKAVSSNAGRIGRPAAALAAVSALMLGVGVPAQASATVPAASSAMPAASVAVPASSSYTVQSGDTLGLIAARQGVSLNTVFALNGLGMSSIIYPGQSIRIAGATSTPAPAPAAYAAPAPAAPAPAAPAPAVANAAADSSVSTLSLASSTVTRIPTNSINATILASAKAQLGAVQDCTVLGEQALRAAGISGVGDESPASLMRFATPVADPQPGDFIYYADGGMGFAHNAIYLGGGMAIHSGWTGNQTTRQPPSASTSAPDPPTTGSTLSLGLPKVLLYTAIPCA